MKLRVYIDTSVIGGCLDEEFAVWSLKLFDEFHKGSKIAVVSDLTLRELEQAPKEVKDVLAALPRGNIETVFLSRDAEELASQYVKKGAVGRKHIVDAQHIAVASIERVDVLVSWNFQQIVNLNRIHAFNAVNLLLSYPVLEIRSPREVLYERKV